MLDADGVATLIGYEREQRQQDTDVDVAGG
jgi:hypothetical protein